MSKPSESDQLLPVSPYWRLEGDVSNGLNRLKGKIFNLIDATIIGVDALDQRGAIKGLIRGFANDEYRLIVENMRHDAIEAEFLSKEESEMIPPLTATPLGEKLYVASETNVSSVELV